MLESPESSMEVLRRSRKVLELLTLAAEPVFLTADRSQPSYRYSLMDCLIVSAGSFSLAPVRLHRAFKSFLLSEKRYMPSISFATVELSGKGTLFPLLLSSEVK